MCRKARPTLRRSARKDFWMLGALPPIACERWMERMPRMADSQYFPLFQGEMRGYIAALREQVQVLASPTRFGTTREDALTVLRQTGHTLAGLGTTVELPDVALLGEALNEAAQHLLADTDSAARRISVPLTYLTVHLETRLARMSTAARFL